MSKLQLNVPVLDYKAFPEEGTSPNTQQMPLLISDGRVPLSVYGLMKRRLEVLNAPKNVKLAWWDNYFDTGDGAVRHSDGRFKVIPDAQYLRMLTPKTKLVDGAVILSDDVYKGLAGEEFSKAKVDMYFGRELSKAEVKAHPGWLALARGDKALLGEFADATFAQAKQRWSYDGKMMGIYASHVPNEGAAGRLWSVNRLNVSIDDSGANGDDHLVNNYGRLVGVAPEAQRAAGQPLEQRVKA